MVDTAPILTFAVNQSHIDTVAMLPKHFTKWRLLQGMTGTTYYIFRRVYVSNIYQMLTLYRRRIIEMVLNSFTQGYIHNSYISNDILPCVLMRAECDK